MSPEPTNTAEPPGGGGGGATTVIALVSLLPSLDAETLALATVGPVPRPLADTVASLGLRLVQVIGRPVSVLPLASRSTAVSCTVRLVSTETDAGVTVTEATAAGGGGGGGVTTVMVAVSLLPSLKA